MRNFTNFKVGDLVNCVNDRDMWESLSTHKHLTRNSKLEVIEVRNESPSRAAHAYEEECGRSDCYHTATHPQSIKIRNLQGDHEGNIRDGWASGFWFDPIVAEEIKKTEAL